MLHCGKYTNSELSRRMSLLHPVNDEQRMINGVIILFRNSLVVCERIITDFNELAVSD